MLLTKNRIIFKKTSTSRNCIMFTFHDWSGIATINFISKVLRQRGRR